ncbi:hypothetical protein A2867_03740 [Candidatus Daviesbacteria bacterium RIFCSPHIGHO2_01_FULL_40_11]|uniref:Uncharacterized protein n=1 Tax=Candidatus Daviesbacteria bacterium RIFCSPHIGHO2_01_FULL_40_11 TaxID=1797762 RepID=A0A1F5JG33_9BACT|nr:MAG: hypothetical protein A2867_03740 [Candidatus Daviesbacteria bacterium RIFCSPHIGHO2_01_FULL_40_11]
MNIRTWIKENLILSLKVDLTNLKIKVFLVPLYFIVQIVTYLYFRNSLYQNGFWVIMIPMLFTLVVVLIYLLPKRNNPNYQIYYLFHLSKFSKIIIIIAAVAMIGLYFFAQCREFGLTVGISCLKSIIR